MSPNIEFEGKSIDKAVETACLELKTSQDKLEYEVITEGSSGIFGLVGAKNARIRVKAPDSPETDDFSREGVLSLVDEAFNSSTGKADDRVTKNKKKNRWKKKEPKAKEDIPESVVALGKEAVQKFADFITNGATVIVKQKSGRLEYDVEGGNASILIGKKGQNLEAIQYLTEKMVNKQSHHRIRLSVDVEGYLEERKNNLKTLAKKMAEKTKRTGKPSTIGQMNSHDRRIVHMTLRGDRKVRTQSIGEGYYRKLVVFPKKNNRRKKGYQKKK